MAALVLMFVFALFKNLYNPNKTKIDLVLDMIRNFFGNVWMKNYSSSLVGYWSISGPLHSRIFSSILLLIFWVLSSAQPSASTQEVPTVMYNLICHNPDKRPPHRWRIESWIKGTTMVDFPDIILFTGIMFTALCFYNKCGSLFAYCTYGTSFLINEFNNLSEKIKNLIEKIWIKLKENRIEYLGAVFQVLNIALSSSLLRSAQGWKSNFIAGIAIFALLCYCVEVSVELKRLGVTRTSFPPERMNNIVVWCFTENHVLQFLFPLLTCVYKIHHMEDIWGSVSFIIQMSIHVVGQLDSCMFVIYIISMQPIDNIPPKGNKILWKTNLSFPRKLQMQM